MNPDQQPGDDDDRLGDEPQDAVTPEAEIASSAGEEAAAGEESAADAEAVEELPAVAGSEDEADCAEGNVEEGVEEGNVDQGDVDQGDVEVGEVENETVAGDEVADDEIDREAAEAAVAAEAGTAEVEGSLDELADTELGEDGLPIVPELKDAGEVARMVYVLMMTSRETMSVFRLAQACNTTQKIVEEALVLLQEQLKSLGLPVELARTGDSVRWMSGAVAFPYLQRLRGVKKLEKLSPAALETLAVIAYRQPVMRSEIEAIRGVKAGPMLRTLLQHKLVKVAGRAEVPGRPLQYGTTQQFLERFGLASLQELPSVKEWKNLG